MADQRVAVPTRLVDATTLTQGLAIDSGGNASVNLGKVNGNTVLTGNGVTGTGSLRVTIASDNTAFAVNATLQAGAAVIGSLAANQSVNVAQINGVAPSMGNGVSGTGVQRVTIASDSTGQVTLATGSATIGALTANQSVNTAQIAGTTTATGNGTASAGCQRVTIASDNTAFSVNATINPPTNPAWDITNVTTPVTLAANASGNLDSASIASKFLRQAVVSGSVPFKVILSSISNGTATAKVVLFGGPLDPVVYSPPYQTFIQSGSTGTNGFRAAVTNLDPSLSGDFYASYAYSDN